MSQEQGFWEKAWSTIKSVPGMGLESTTDAMDTLSGKKIEEQLEEFRKVFAPVLLGLHDQVRGQEQRLGLLEKATAEQVEKTRSFEEGLYSIRQQFKSVTTSRNVAFVALGVSLISLGVALWASP
ncbi:MAG: hypothetical protein HY681_10885 [Chloroflexi bacterium]|nr:hypothetical protein [Chloroflexota bacterium]